MDPQSKSKKMFGAGPREICGASDLVNKYKLWSHHEVFCKRLLPLSISETHYLRNVVGDTQIRKGDGMELDQLFQKTDPLRERKHIHPFDLVVLREAFHMRETTPIDLPSVEKGIPTALVIKSEPNDKKKTHKKHKDRHKDKKEKDKNKDHKHRHHKKERSNKNDGQGNGIVSSAEHLKKQHKKRRHD